MWGSLLDKQVLVKCVFIYMRLVQAKMLFLMSTFGKGGLAKHAEVKAPLMIKVAVFHAKCSRWTCTLYCLGVVLNMAL